MLVVGDGAYRLNQLKGTTAMTIKSKEVRSKMLKEEPAAQGMGAEGEGRGRARESNS